VVKVKTKPQSQVVSVPAPEKATDSDMEMQATEASVAESNQTESTKSEVPEPAIVTEEPDANEPVVEAKQNIEADEAESLFHVVQPKENLYRLSLKYNIKLNTLKEWNNLDENGSINVGMKLWLVPPAQQTN
jgi:type IV pilus assembly protein PilF